LTQGYRPDRLRLSPEGALTLAAMSQLLNADRIKAGATVVCVNTATGLRYPHLLEARSAPKALLIGTTWSAGLDGGTSGNRRWVLIIR